MSKIRINELARELEVKPSKILDLLPELGVSDKKTHSSSLDDDVADAIRRHFGFDAAPPAARVRRDGEGEEDSAPSRVESPAAVASPVDKAPLVEKAPPVVGKPAAPPAVAKPVEPAPLGPSDVPSAPLQPAAHAPASSAPAAHEESKGPLRAPVQPLRPPLAGKAVVPPMAQPVRPAVPVSPSLAPPTPASPAERPSVAKAEPPAPASPTQTSAPPAAPAPASGSAVRPGQIISGPRQPLPSGLAPESPRPSAVPGAPVPPPPRTPAPPARPSAPQAAGPVVSKANLAGQPAPRPVVPPRPDMVARLQGAQPRAAMPGQPAPPRPGAPRPASPVPGQPIYRGPVRPGQPVVRGPGMPGPGGPAGPGGFRTARRGMHPTASPLQPETAPVPTDTRRHQAKPGARTARERARDQEGKLLGPVRPREETVVAVNKEITIGEGVTVKELSEKLGIKASLVIKRLLEKKIFATINQTLDVKLAEDLAQSFGASSSHLSFEDQESWEVELAEEEKDVVKRAPVVTVMGHVDHGKTSLLDAIRQANVAEREAGGITQHIGAYQVRTPDGKRIVFIDTPGHEAFTRMRARGAKVTDIVILVVAADDGVMPQTLEAINHAKAAGVPIIVAINKIDKADAQADRIKQQLSDRGLLAEDWGGDTVMVPVSARTKQNIELLLEMVNLVSELQNLKANPSRPAICTVLEAKLDRGRGPVATLLVRNGTLRVGDFFICGTVFGKVRALINDVGDSVKEAEPSTPVEVMGLEELPEVGDALQVVTDTAKAKQIVMYREGKAREQAMAKSSRLTLESLHKQLREGETKELNIILKTDVGGSSEVLSDMLQKLSTDKVKIRVLHSGVGAITEYDVLLASASDAIVIGFNVRPERNAAAVAEQEKVDIRLHTIIYELTTEIKKAMLGLLDPVFKEVYKGRADVRDTFRISKVGMVAGCYVTDGSLSRGNEVRLLRDNIVIHTGKIEGLRRFKDDVSEVKSGFECGVSLHNFNDVKPGDVLEAFVTEKVVSEALA